jgi:methionyl-tRNA formyltransferase
MKTKDLKSVFFGTSQFSVYVLDALKEKGVLPTLIITMPDRPKGRNLIMTPPEVKVWAEKNGIDVHQPEKIDENEIAKLRSKQQKAPRAPGWDIFMLASYGKILPQALLDIPRHGTLNVHPSLLPKYRGASPIQSQILSDDRETGVTIMLMDDKMDHGAILAQARVEIEEKVWPLKNSVLEEVLGNIGGTLLAETLPEWISGEIKPEAQKEEDATFTQKIKKENGEIDLDGDPRRNLLEIQAFNTSPGTHFFVKKDGKDIRVKIKDAHIEDEKLVITHVIPEGKKEMLYEDFTRG